MRIVVALGGNALLERGERPDADVQRRHVARAAAALAPLARRHQLLVCHGNGPQIGLLALESAADRSLSAPYPLDVLNGQTQGMIGYWLVQELRNAGVTAPVAAVVTQTVVDGDDPAFGSPTKFIGPVYDADTARRLAARHGWTVRPDGDRWRRVVPSPAPLRVVEQAAAAQLLDAGAVVVLGGGGGVPVVEDGGRLRGVDAVVDKDATASLLARQLRADRLLVLTDVPALMAGFGTADARPVPVLGVDDIGDDDYPAGSMGPKVTACRDFTAATGNPSAIGGLDDAPHLLDGTRGTAIVPGAQPAAAVAAPPP
ncbi:amino acid kinase family protein [Jatrophihabitans fulvus]